MRTSDSLVTRRRGCFVAIEYIKGIKDILDNRQNIDMFTGFLGEIISFFKSKIGKAIIAIFLPMLIPIYGIIKLIKSIKKIGFKATLKYLTSVRLRVEQPKLFENGNVS